MTGVNKTYAICGAIRRMVNLFILFIVCNSFPCTTVFFFYFTFAPCAQRTAFIRAEKILRFQHTELGFFIK